MDYGTIIGSIDLAQVALILFTLFFFALVIWLQRENMREGYPLVNDDGSEAKAQGAYGVPSPKTFILPNDQGEIQVPDVEREAAKERTDLALERTGSVEGMPFEPTGDPLADGVGPAAWVAREDKPELDGHGHPKIQPMASIDTFTLAKSSREVRGLPVMDEKGVQGATVKDLWIDIPEQFVRYYEIELPDGTSRLIPQELVRIRRDRFLVHALYADQFAGVPTITGPAQVTKLEEEKVAAYWAGGKLYADQQRLNPAV